MPTTSSKTLHAVVVAGGIFAVAIYGYLAYSAVVPGWSQTLGPDAQPASKITYLLQDVLFFPGLPPALVAAYFFLLGKGPRDWLAGLGLVLGFVLVHYFVASLMAHSSPSVYVPLMVVELAAAIGLIVVWHRRSLAVNR
jgi:hypothetical protein